ncbi:MAG: alpha/beta hydrolase [Acidobacteria bacterium]|nr:alpha/beta hydrolase [Acidobacteriota bacterium]
MSEKTTRINGVDICSESFGLPEHPCILLIMGAMASMIWWDSEFCSRLASRNRFVIRYDNRDVGRSTCSPPGETLYTMHDLTDDAIGVLDSYGILKAHFVGLSLGGMIAQIAALKYPGRVLSVTAISSGVFDDRPDLPGTDPKILSYHSRAAQLDWNNREMVLEYMIGGWELLNGSRHPFDYQQARRLSEAEISRANSLKSMFNHALLAGAEELYGTIGRVSQPFLVIHGTEDPVLPYAHGKALAEAVQNSRLLTLEGAGHELHRNDWDTVIEAIVEHTGR